MNPMPANSCSRPSTAERSSAFAFADRRGAGSAADFVGKVVLGWLRAADESEDADERDVAVDRVVRVAPELRALGPQVAIGSSTYQVGVRPSLHRSNGDQPAPRI